MSVHLLKNNFTRGVFSPKASSRVDLPLYQGGAETLRNFISIPQGGIRRRSGTRFVGTCDAGYLTNMIEFNYNSTGDAYILEFGHLTIRFWTRNADGVYGLVTTSTGAVLSVTTTYSHLDVHDIQFLQVGDTVYLAHPSYQPRALVRTTATSWSLTALTFIDGPYGPINDNGVSGSPPGGFWHSSSGGSGTTLTATGSQVVGSSFSYTFSQTAAINGDAGLTSADIGRLIRAKATGGNKLWYSILITAVATTTTFTGTVMRVGCGLTDLDAARDAGTISTATASWRFSVWSDTLGWPACVEMFEGRLVWSRSTAFPRSLWFSRVGLPIDFGPSHGDATTDASLGITLDIIAGEVDKILWLKEAPRLQIGTASGIRTVGGTDTGTPLSQSNVSQRLEVAYGFDETRPRSIGESTIAAGRGGVNVRHVHYDYQVNGLVAPDVSRLSEHLFTAPIRKIAYQNVPEQIAWVLLGDGTVIGVTYDQQEQIIAYHTHDFGGDYSFVVDIAVRRGADRDELWLQVERIINGTYVRYMEVLEAPFDTEADELEDGFFVDCGATYSGVATNTVSGLTHLANTAVDVLADGSVKTGLTVDSSGVLTLANSQTASLIHIGLNITSEFKTLRAPHQQDDGFTIGRKQRAVDVRADVLRTGELRVGRDEDSNTPIQNRLGQQAFGTPSDLKGGVYHQRIDDSWQGGQIYGVVDKPHPCFLRSLMINLDVESQRPQ